MILTTTDGSDASLRALPHAAHLARALGRDLLLVRVADKRALTGRVDGDEDTDSTGLASLSDELDGHLRGLDVQSAATVVQLMVDEKPWEAILRAAIEHGAEAIVMATSGAGAIRESVLGSVVSAVKTHTPVPLMMVGPAAREPDGRPPYHIVIATDCSPFAYRVLPAAETLLQKAPLANLKLTFLRIYRPALGDGPDDDVMEQCRAELQEFAERATVSFPFQVELREDEGLSSSNHAISEAAGELGASAIWMASHRHSWQRRLLQGSVAMAVVHDSAIPVIVTRAEDSRD